MTARQDWTLEEALAAQEAFERDSPGAPRGPLYQWETLRTVEGLKGSKDKRDILYALFKCFLDELMPPDWLALAFIRLYHRGLQGDISSWDDVFGNPPRTKGQWDRFMRDARQLPQIVRLVEGRSPDTPINADLFEDIGEQLSPERCKTSVENLYRRARKPRR